MENRQSYLENKLKDYKSFIHILFILSIYFYLGVVIDAYAMPYRDHTITLSIFSIGSLSAITIIMFRYNKIRQELEKDN